MISGKFLNQGVLVSLVSGKCARPPSRLSSPARPTHFAIPRPATQNHLKLYGTYTLCDIGVLCRVSAKRWMDTLLRAPKRVAESQRQSPSSGISAKECLKAYKPSEPRREKRSLPNKAY